MSIKDMRGEIQQVQHDVQNVDGALQQAMQTIGQMRDQLANLFDGTGQTDAQQVPKMLNDAMDHIEKGRAMVHQGMSNAEQYGNAL